MIYIFEDFKLDTTRKLLFRLPENEKVSLTNKAFELLRLLVENSGKLVSKDKLMATVWKDSFVEEANLTQTISVLRKKLGEKPRHHRFIVTETGKGYRFVAQVTKPSSVVPSTHQNVKQEFSDDDGKNLTENQNNNARTYYLLAAIGFLVICSIIGAYSLWTKPTLQASQIDEFDWAKATIKPLTNKHGGEYFPSLAPDGESFVYTAKTKDNFDVFLRRVDGNKEINLTENSIENDTQPAFSPDGKLIAFRSDRDGGGIFIMEETGENPRRICDIGFHPSWSPDGKQIVVSERGNIRPTNRGKSSLWIVNVANGVKREIIEDRTRQPSWSPNGKRIAYWSTTSEGSQRNIATISVEGGEPTVIPNPASENWNPVWSPDGKYLYYASNANGNMGFWRIKIDETSGKTLGEPEIVQTPGKFNGHLSFSSDGERLIYVQMNNKSNLKAVEFDSEKRIPKGEPYWITRGDYEIRNPSLSPDEKDFVVTFARLTQDDVVLIDRTGKNWRDLTNDKYFNRYPNWSPDGKQIAFTSDRSGIHQIWMMNSDGTDLRQITNNQKSTSFPIWSPDGKSLVYRKERVKSYIVDLTKDINKQTQKEIPVSEELKSYVHWDWSPTGEKLVGRWGTGEEESGIGYLSLKTNQYIKLWKGISSMPKWLPDSERVVFSHNGKIHILDTNSKEFTEIPNLLEENVSYVGINSLGNLLYFTVSSDESNIWLLDLKQN